jgi:predicted PurR-regulated permease PerM
MRLGARAWALLGVIILACVVAVLLGGISGIVIPLIIAVILGTVFEPLVELLVRLRLPRALASAIGLMTALVAASAIVFIVTQGLLIQLPEITRQALAGWNYLLEWARSLDLDAAMLDRWREQLTEFAPQASLGLLGFVTTTVYGLVSFAIGTFFALFFFYFVLRDSHRFPAWFARATGIDQTLIEQVDGDVRLALRGYFRGVAVTAVITAPIFVIPLLLLRVPLVIPIVILYFVLSFVPYLGAWITGAFAILIAFGSGGPVTALIVAICLLVSNGTIQSAVSSWALGSSLRLHPVLVLLATLVGGSVAGVLGMILGAPLVAAAQKSISRIRAASEPGSH